MTAANPGIWAGLGSERVRSSFRLPMPVWVLCGYLFLITVFGKGPTYLGVPPLFIGEIALLVSYVWLVDRYGLQRALVGDQSLLAYLVAGFMALGAILTAGYVGEFGTNAIRDAAIWYYGAFFFVGQAIGTDHVLGARVWRILTITWAVALIWGTVDLTLLMAFGWGVSEFGPILPWRGESLFFNSNYEEVQQVALACILVLHPRLHQGNLGAWQKPLMVVSVVALALVLAAHGRGVKVGLGLAAVLLVLLYFAPGKSLHLSRQMIAVFILIPVIIAVGWILFSDDFLRATSLDRFIEANPSGPAGTAFWRIVWWKVLWREVNDHNPLFGLGFGQSLSIYNPYLLGDEHTAWPVRSPHNFNITIFSRMGFVGLASWLSVFFVGIGGLFMRVWRGRGALADPLRREEAAFWIVLLVATWGNGTFGVLMEGPVLGIWFWFALGFAYGRSGPLRSIGRTA